MTYSIGEFAQLCGINATTLRAWQRRYGLLKPQRTDGGHRLYNDDDIQQALKILDWVKKGACQPGQTPAGASRRTAAP
jgi:DNA-binding transcriptional MerR regulator